MRPSRRAFLFSSVAAAASVPSYGKWLESGWFEVTRKRIPLRGLPAPLRLLHLSDLHAGHDTPFSSVEHALELGLAESPDLACLTGDFITAGLLRDPAAYTGVLKGLAKSIPAFASFGNHDGGRWTSSEGHPLPLSAMRRVIEAAGIACLHNQTAVAGPPGRSVNLVGLGDLWANDLDPGAAFKDAAAGSPTIVLSHNPDTVQGLLRQPWELLLAGHTHGGQVVIPVAGYAPYVPVRDRRFLRGLCPVQGRHVHVTRGVGAILGIRLNCRPEVSLLELVPA